MTDYPERDHGYGKPADPIGPPKAKMMTEDSEDFFKVKCPNCKCPNICEVEVPVKEPLLKGGFGRGRYLGCPACPWASPMVMIALDAEFPPESD